MSDYDRWKTRSDLDDPAAQNHAEPPPAEDRFSVWQFLKGGISERVRDGVTAKEAVEAAHHYTHNVSVKLGLTERVIIVDDDSCVFEWLAGQGITWPLEAKGRP